MAEDSVLLRSNAVSLVLWFQNFRRTSFLTLLDTADEGTTILRKVESTAHGDTASRLRKKVLLIKRVSYT